MQPALLIRLRPSGPWRYGPGDGALDRVDELYRSDRLFSAVTLSMQRLGFLDEWLDATARGVSEPAIAFSSLFPYQSDTLFAIPPNTLWPPPAAQVTAPNAVFLAKIRWKSARFVPLSLIDLLATGGSVLADQWLPDPESGCLLRRDRPNAAPFRIATRSRAAVDRLASGRSFVASYSCVEFEPGAGLWTLARYRDAAAHDDWNERLQAVFRLLADSGFGGKRSSGWGQSQEPEFQNGAWPNLLLPKVGRLSDNGSPGDPMQDHRRYWLLSLYLPAPADKIDWRSGDYTVTVRAGRTESVRQSGAQKKAVRMVTEGSVLVAEVEPAGAAVDVAPENFEHPVFRSGLALALQLPLVVPQAIEEMKSELLPVEEIPTEEETPEPLAEASQELEAPTEPEAVAETAQPEKEPEAGEPEIEPPLSPEIQPDPETESEPPATAPEPPEEEPAKSEEPGDAL